MINSKQIIFYVSLYHILDTVEYNEFDKFPLNNSTFSYADLKITTFYRKCQFTKLILVHKSTQGTRGNLIR